MRKNTAPPRVNVKKGDTVIVLSGKDAGKAGEVIAVFPRLGKVTLASLNMVTRHQKPRRDSTVGVVQQGLIEKPAPLYSSKVMLQCPHCHKGTRPHRVMQPDGHRARVCRKCQKTID